MYVPESFAITDKKEIFRFIEDNGFGQLISNSEGRLFSTPIPFILSEDKSLLLGHLARNNPQVKDIDGQEILVTLQGPHHYISPSWYNNPGVPTWNYQAVHIYGLCRLVNESSTLGRMVDRLTEKYESQYREPWRPDYRQSLLGAIVGIEIAITEMQCKYKLSQNRPPEDQAKIIEHLALSGSTQLAEAMKRDNS
ncbi:MAG: FMN-binding negative transcriptional regulator [Candidatus Thiodiazotropha sp.]